MGPSSDAPQRAHVWLPHSLISALQAVELHRLEPPRNGLLSTATSLAGFPLQLIILDSHSQGEAKAVLVEEFGASQTIAIGNGANDVANLSKAGLSSVVNGSEGCACETLLAADILVPDIGAALDLLLKPERLIATWRR